MDKEVIIETDLGHDPDDYFAICWLAAMGVKIKALTITPGDVDQIAMARFLRKELGMDFPIGVSKLDREKFSSGGMYYDILKKYGLFGNLHKEKFNHDGEGVDVIYGAYDGCQDFLVIGPATNVGNFIGKSNYDNYNFDLFMQGGFLPYSQNPYLIKQIDKFKDVEAIGTFNFNGDHKAIRKICDSKIRGKYFIGKHICHTVTIDKNIASNFDYKDNIGSVLFGEALNVLFKYTDSKKFHDPLVAVEYFYNGLYSPLQYIKGNIIHTKGGWTTQRDDSSDCNIVANIDYDHFWNLLGGF